MQTARIAIVGGGLSGLYAAFLLEQMGIRDYVLLEARARLGGRIACAPPETATANGINRFDLGPSWFWPDFQPQLDQLIHKLDLARFPQFDSGDMLVEHAADNQARRIVGYTNVPTSMRLVGGMESLIDALYQKLDTTRILTGQAVQQLRAADTYVELDSLGHHGQTTDWRVEHVLLATPPRLAETTIIFTPA